MAGRLIEVLYFESCPHHASVTRTIRELLERCDGAPTLVTRRVESEEAARDLRFLGSPTVRVDGRDIEPGAERRSDYGLKCRLYRTSDGVDGVPPGTWIRAAIRSTGR